MWRFQIRNPQKRVWFTLLIRSLKYLKIERLWWKNILWCEIHLLIFRTNEHWSLQIYLKAVSDDQYKRDQIILQVARICSQVSPPRILNRPQWHQAREYRSDWFESGSDGFWIRTNPEGNGWPSNYNRCLVE